MDQRLLKVMAIIKGLINRKFFGKVILSFEAGKITNVNVGESIQITE
jgi:hypothetical protein